MLHPSFLETASAGCLSPDDTGPVYPIQLLPFFENNDPGSSKPAHQCMAFHFGMWLDSQKEEINFRVMVDMAVLDSPVTNARWQPIWVLFAKAKDRNAWLRWIARYAKWFGDQDLNQKYFPEIPKTGKHTLTFCEIPSAMIFDPMTMERKYPEGCAERWAWVLQNCKKPVYQTPTGLAFVNSTEAIHFKLKWC